MTLKEFSKDYLSLDTVEGQPATWRKAFPMSIRYEEVVIRKEAFIFPAKTRLVLQELWVRYHKGDIIDREWRPVHVELIPNYER